MLMPSAPVVISSPAVLEGLMQAADAVRRLEKLKNSGYINKDEYARERQAVELAINHQHRLDLQNRRNSQQTR